MITKKYINESLEIAKSVDHSDVVVNDLSKRVIKLANEISNLVEARVILQGELLPCPFCGGEASIGTTRISDKRTRELNNRDNGFFVNCKICGSNNNCLHLGYATKEIATNHWNKRAGREPQSK